MENLKERTIRHWNEIKSDFIKKALNEFYKEINDEETDDPTGNVCSAYIMDAEDRAWEKAIEIAEREDKIISEVNMSLTQYDLYSDFCERCQEFGIEPFLSEEDYINGFNITWYCPKGYKTAYDRCIEWHKE